MSIARWRASKRDVECTRARLRPAKTSPSVEAVITPVCTYYFVTTLLPHRYRKVFDYSLCTRHRINLRPTRFKRFCASAVESYV